MIVINEDTIGEVFCRCDTGERFQITAVSTGGFSIQNENGTQHCITGHTINATPERDPSRIAAFHANRNLARCLNAAEQAAKRHQNDPLSQEEATRVAQIAQQQRQALQSKLDRGNAPHSHSLDAALQSARDRCRAQTTSTRNSVDRDR